MRWGVSSAAFLLLLLLSGSCGELAWKRGEKYIYSISSHVRLVPSGLEAVLQGDVILNCHQRATPPDSFMVSDFGFSVDGRNLSIVIRPTPDEEPRFETLSYGNSSFFLQSLSGEITAVHIPVKDGALLAAFKRGLASAFQTFIPKADVSMHRFLVDDPMGKHIADLFFSGPHVFTSSDEKAFLSLSTPPPLSPSDVLLRHSTVQRIEDGLIVQSDVDQSIRSLDGTTGADGHISLALKGKGTVEAILSLCRATEPEMGYRQREPTLCLELMEKKPLDPTDALPRVAKESALPTWSRLPWVVPLGSYLPPTTKAAPIHYEL